MSSQDPKETSDVNSGAAAPIQIDYGNPFASVKEDFGANNIFISQNGILMMHYMAVPDVINQKVAGDLRANFGQENNSQFENRDDLHRENGFIYIKQKPIHVVFTSNSKNLQYTPAGLYNDSGAYATINRHYSTTNETANISEYDKLIPCEPSCETFSVNWQKFQHNPTGVDRLQYPATQVLYMIDSDGVTYTQDIDFNLQAGVIRWIGGNRPGMDSTTNQGKMVAIRYTYKPYFYIKTVMHDFRSVPTLDEYGNSRTRRGPMQALLQADWVWLDSRRNNENDNDAQLDAPDGGNTGDR